MMLWKYLSQLVPEADTSDILKVNVCEWVKEIIRENMKNKLI